MAQKYKVVSRRRSTFSVIFYINRQKIKKNGLCPIMGRITIDKSIAQFSVKSDIDPKLWDAKSGRVLGSGREANKINHTLNGIAKKMEDIYTELTLNEAYVSAELVKNTYNGVGRKETMLLKLFAEHNEEYEKRVGVNRVKESYYAYTLSYKHLSNFIKQKYEVEDVSVHSLKLSFIDDYDFYLRVDKRMSQRSISGHMINLKKMVRRAVNQGTLRCDPFFHYIPEQPKRKCRHLTEEEIHKIMQVHIASKAVCHTRDMFVFSCFTGLAYVDLYNLSEEHIKITPDGSWWISIDRQKTGTNSTIRLLDIPKQIIEKYRHGRKSNKIFNVVSLSCMCANLRKIEKLCDIEYVTFHMARHNFGTHITLSQGVPIETVSRMMGHNSITTTQIYAEVTSKKVSEDMKKLSNKITGRYTVFEDQMMPVGIRNTDNFRLNDNTINPNKTKRNYEKRSNRNKAK